MRLTDKGNLQTNIRLGKTDYLLRVKYKTDKTPWKTIVPPIIPEYIPKPDLNLLKSGETNTENTENTSQTPPRPNLWQHFLAFKPDGQD